MRVYLDNAATTPLDKRVAGAMSDVMKNTFGNPSSIHHQGREARTLIEKARRSVSELLKVEPGEIFFTSGGTEADNTALYCSVFDQKVDHIISSGIEHHAVLHALDRLKNLSGIKVSYVNLRKDGHIDLDHLESLLKKHSKDKILVTLMHANNEIGNLLDLKRAGEITKKYGALFHSDTVQSIGHLPVDPKSAGVDLISASAHKFNGPKGTGFIYINEDVQFKPLINGGGQERNMRGGTENIYGIAGLQKALEIAYDEMDEQRDRILDLKRYMKEKLKEEVPGVMFNGDTSEEGSLFTILNASFTPSSKGEMLLFNLDIGGISVSGGSACSSGSDIGSHVLNTLVDDENRVNVRFSFGKYNTREEIDYAIKKVREHL